MDSRELARLKAKYGDAAIETGMALEPTRFLRKLAMRDRLDQHYTKLWLDYGYGGINRRPGLDRRTRLLVLVAQAATRKNQEALADALRAAFASPIPAREILEVVLHCQIYGGTDVADSAIETFYAVIDELDKLDELKAGELPLDGRDAGRSLEDERKTWAPADAADPRLPPLLERHGWHGISVGLRLRPKHHIDQLTYFDALSSAFATIWLKYTYNGFYNRGILDDRTRLLCLVGNMIALGREPQARSHMAGAMRAGAKPGELLEIILMSSFYLGQPVKVSFLRVLVELMASQGRLAEIGNPPAPVA